MNIESDEVFISSGVVNNISTGAPIALRIKNKDWENWKDKDIEPGDFEKITVTFDSKGRNIGDQNKTVTLFSNAKPLVLIIRGKISFKF